MKFRDFQLPDKIKWIEEKENYGKFVCEPFERGYGHTIGNSLRRILLASMEGAVITQVKIAGAQHEYSSLEGIKEDVLEILFNLKRLRFKLFTEDSQRITLIADGEKTVTGKDFELNESVKLLNPDEYIATLDENGKLNMEVQVERGRGYSRAEERIDKMTSVGEIPVDAAFSPIRRVNYEVENARVGQTTNYDKLVLEVWTDGSVSPREAVAYAAQILGKTLKVFSIPEAEDIELGVEETKAKEAQEVKDMPIEDLEMGARIINSLKRGGINTVLNLLEKTEKDLLKIEKVGEKTVEELKNKLESINKDKGLELKLKE